ncbi:hypothetical protein JW930_04900 [Candidatus Woesearchaeota archaeon]|nr:hypothetical protein [Candidatus Woesearchaeota archaeon]
MNIFDSLELLEPKCPGCGCTLDYGTNTKYDSKIESHVCLLCGCTLR